jgi:hypothetical protein
MILIRTDHPCLRVGHHNNMGIREEWDVYYKIHVQTCEFFKSDKQKNEAGVDN